MLDSRWNRATLGSRLKTTLSTWKVPLARRHGLDETGRVISDLRFNDTNCRRGRSCVVTLIVVQMDEKLQMVGGLRSLLSRVVERSEKA